MSSIWLEVFWAQQRAHNREHNRRVDGDWLLQIANTSVGQQEPLHRGVECDHTCLQRAPPTAIIMTMPPHCPEVSPKPAAPCLFKTSAAPAVNRTLDMAFIQNLWHPFGVNSLGSIFIKALGAILLQLKNTTKAVIGCNAAQEIIQMSRRGTKREARMPKLS